MENSEFVFWLARESVDPLFNPWIANAWNCQTTANVFSKRGHKLEKWLPVKPKKKPNEKQLRSSLAHLVVRQETVLISETGSKYHKAGCRCISPNSKRISISEAGKYKPCKVCKVVSEKTVAGTN